MPAPAIRCRRVSTPAGGKGQEARNPCSGESRGRRSQGEERWQRSGSSFGRPITGDHYYKLAHGPIPTRGLDLLRGQGSPAEVALLQKYVTVIGVTIHPRQAPERNEIYFSCL